MSERLLAVSIQKLHPDAQIPAYQRAGDAGFDLRALEPSLIPPGATALIRTGLAFAIPEGFEMQIRPRSSLGLTTPLIMPNAPGTIDAGYRGEVGIILRNLSNAPWQIAGGERIAQGVIAPVARAVFREAPTLPPTDRGAGGFGSTGRI